jgi:hypothetical protein
MTTTNEQIKWIKSDNNYYSAPDGVPTGKIEPGVYKIIVPQFSPWVLSMERSDFYIPFKVYGINRTIIDRVKRAWEKTESSLGILLNGLKGSGKTVTAQILCNELIGMGYAVIVCDYYTPVIDQLIRGSLSQDVVFLFDEFEKNFKINKDDEDSSDSQQKLLSLIDGLGKTQYKKMFLFTTNHENIDENLIDRPSRIRYKYTFSDMTPEVTMEIIEDLLDPAYAHLKDKILSYITNLSVKSIDAVKSVVNEVNIFGEDPSSFEDFFNLSKKKPSSYLFSGKYKIYDTRFNQAIKFMSEENRSSYRGHHQLCNVAIFSEDFRESPSDIYLCELDKNEIKYIPRYSSNSDLWWSKLPKECLAWLKNNEDDDEYFCISNFFVLNERDLDIEKNIIKTIVEVYENNKDDQYSFTRKMNEYFPYHCCHPYGKFDENYTKIYENLFERDVHENIPFKVIKSKLEPVYASGYFYSANGNDL